MPMPEGGGPPGPLVVMVPLFSTQLLELGALKVVVLVFDVFDVHAAYAFKLMSNKLAVSR